MRAGVFAVSSIFGAIGFIGAATAAPQVLMVVTPSDEMLLTCENGICSTEVAAICLQPDRSNPKLGKSFSVRASDANIRGARSSAAPTPLATLPAGRRKQAATQLPSEPGRRWRAAATAPPVRDQWGAADYLYASTFCQHGAEQLRGAA